MPKQLPLTYKHNNCQINAYINMRNHYKNKSLTLVFGSLGINGWFEYGGKNWSVNDFKKKIDGYSSDCHCWLEDDKGNVYDYLHEEYNNWVLFRTKRKMKRTGLIEGVSKKDLANDGIEYIPASFEAQKLLFLSIFDLLWEIEIGLKKGTHGWLGTHIYKKI